MLFAVLIACRVADKFVVFRKLRRRAHHLRDIEMRRLQLEGKVIERYPRFCIHLRVVNCYGEFQCVGIHTVEALLNAQIGTVRTTRSVDPDFVINAAGLHDECRVVLSS